MSKTITGKWIYTNNTGVANGVLYLTLSQDATISGTGQVAPSVYAITLNSLGEIPAATTILANDELTPSGTVYQATVIAPGGGRVWGEQLLAITGASPININNLIPLLNTSGVVVYGAGGSLPTGTYVFPEALSGLVTPPIAAPAVNTSATGGTIPAGTYYIKTTYVNSNGETTPSPATTVVLGGATSSIVSVGDGGWAWQTGAWGQRVYASNDNTTFYLQTPVVVSSDFMLDSTTHYIKMGAGVQKLFQSLAFSGTQVPITNTAVIDPLQVALNKTRRAPTATASAVPFGTLFVPAIDGTVNPTGQFLLTTPLIEIKSDHILCSGGPNTNVDRQSRIIGASTWNSDKLATVMVFGGDATIENCGVQGQSSNALMVLGPLSFQSGTLAPMKIEKSYLRVPSPAVVGIQVSAFKRSGAVALVNSSNAGAVSGSPGASTAVTAAQNVTAGNLLVCGVTWGGNGAQTITGVTDTAGDTFQLGTVFSYDSGLRIQTVYAENVIGNAANQVTVTFSAATPFVTLNCDQFSGIVAAAALDVTATGTQTGSTATSNLFTTTNANDLIYSVMQDGFIPAAGTAWADTPPHWIAGSGYTIAQDGTVFTRAAAGSQYKSVAGIQTNVTASASFTPALDFTAYVGVGIIYDIYFTDVSMTCGVYCVEYRNAAGGEHYFERGRWNLSGEGAFRNVPGWIDPDAGTHSDCGTGGFCNGVGPVGFKDLRNELGSGRIWDFWNTNAVINNVVHADATIRAGTDHTVRLGSTTGSGNAAGTSLTLINTGVAGSSSNARVGLMVDSAANATSINLVGAASLPTGSTGAIDANNIQLFLNSGLNPASTFSAGNPLTLPAGNLVLNAPNNSVFVGGGSGSSLAANGGQWFEIPDRLVFNAFRGNNDWRRNVRVSLRDSVNQFGVVDNLNGLHLFSHDDTTPLWGVVSSGLMWVRGNARIQATAGGTPNLFIGSVVNTAAAGTIATVNLADFRVKGNAADVTLFAHSFPGSVESLSLCGANCAQTVTANPFVSTNTISGTQLISTIATGTAPLVVASTTQVTNLNASQLVGATWIAPGTIGSGTPNSGAFTTLSATGQITSTLATGTAPFSIASTTNVANLNASSLSGATFAAPGAIGGGTPGSGAFTTLSATGQITSTLATGSSPLVVASTTKVTNLNADLLDDKDSATAGTATTIAARDASGRLTAKRFIADGTALVNTDFVLSAGWGDGPATIGTITGSDQAWQGTITASGIGQGANPTITFTFKDGTWTNAPICSSKVNGGTGAILPLTDAPTATTNVITFVGTPVTTLTYQIISICIGR